MTTRCTVALAALLAIAALPVSSRADDTDKAVARAKACSARASERQLTDAQLKAYLRVCIASEGPLPEPGLSAREIRRRCDAAANSKNLTGEDRRSFLASCERP